MSTTTENLGLFKYDVSADRDTSFSITNALNNNWDKIDNKAVQKTGDTFTGDVTIAKSKPNLTLDDANTANGNYAFIAFKSAKADISESTAPASNKNMWAIYGYDKNNSVTSRIAHLHNTSNNVYTGIETYRQINGETANSYVRIGVQPDGTPYVNTITPSESSNSSSIATTEWVNTKINAIPSVDPTETCVAKAGDIMTGNLTIYKNEPGVAMRNKKLTKGTNPTAESALEVSFNEKNGSNPENRLGKIMNSITTKGVVYTGIYAYPNNANSTTGSGIAIYYPKTGDPYTYAPPSDKLSSIVTTTGISKSQNGYLKLGNGIIIQWGLGNNTSASTTYQELPISYTVTTYTLAFSVSDANNVNAYIPIIKSQTEAGFNYALNSGYTHIGFIALGY